MSAFERDVYRDLADKGHAVEYEKTKVKYTIPARAATYTPDITFTNNPMVIEVKGRFVAEDRKKHELIKAEHPDLDIRFVFQRASAPITKGSKTTLAMWAEKRGFLWAEKRVPEEWLNANHTE